MEVMNASNPDLKSHLAGNIIVTGGCSAAPGLV